MSMSTTINTRCKLKESTRKVQYEIRTEDVQRYLEEKFRFINDALIKRGEKGVEQISVTLRSLRIGKHFLPFIVMLPEAVLDRANFDPNTPSVFRPEEDDDAVRIKPYYYRFLSNYMFTKDDINAFNSGNWKRAAGVTSNGNLQILRRYSHPAIETMNTQNGKSISVMVFLDPLKIFHEMLIDDSNPNQRFSVFIDGMQEVEDNNYVFTVSREINKRNKDEQDQIKNIIRRMQMDRR